MAQTKFELLDSHPSSRSKAAEIRSQVLELLDDFEAVVIDFRRVEIVSSSFADELFGILCVQLGIDALTRRIIFASASDAVLRTIAEAINTRAQ